MKKASVQSRFTVAALSLLFLLSTHLAFCQKVGTPNDLDKNYVPDKSSVLNSKKASADKANRVFDCKNIIEFTPGLLIRNIFALQYEHKFNDYLGLQGGLGMVYGKDMLQAVLNPDGDIFGNNNSTVKLGEVYSNGTIEKNSAYLSAAIRVYTSGGGYYGYYDGSGYFEVGIRHYSNSLQITGNPSSGNGSQIINNPIVDVRSNVYYISYGYHLETDGKLPTTHNFFFGFGMRSTSYNAFSSVGSNSYSGNPVNVMSTTTRDSMLNPTVMFGYELGFGLR